VVVAIPDALRREPPVLTSALAAGTLVRHRVLVIHHAPGARQALEAGLRGQFDVRHAKDAEDAWHRVLTDRSIRAVVASLPVLAIDGYGLLQRIRRSQVRRVTEAPLIVIADHDADAAGGELVTSFGASGVLSLASVDRLPERLLALIEKRQIAPSAQPAQAPTNAPVQVPRSVATPPALVVVSSNAVPVARTPPSPRKPETEFPMSRVDDLNKVLKTLQSSSPGVEASALISSDGLMIASALAKDMDETRVAAMTATLLSLGSRAANELRRGEVSEVIVRGADGYAVMLSAGRGALLLVLATEATPLGLIFFDMREAVKGIKTIL